MTKSINIVRCWLIADNHWLISATSQFAGKRLGSDSGGTVVPALCNARAVLDRGKHEVECVAGALEGIRVLDCSQIIAGPMASSLLSEMGADVVKVEPLEGEPWRLQAEFMPKESRAYMNQNRGKRGIAIDLKHPAAAPVRDALLRWADVVVINYRPGVAEQLGLSYEAVRQIRPNIIYCENTAFGKEGPDAKRRGYDIIAQAMSGLITSSAVLNEGGVPQIVHFAPADALTGALMAWAITAALFHREKTGEGQAVTSSLMQTALMLQPGFKEIVAMDGGARATRLAALAAARERGASMAEIYERRRALTPELLGAVYYRVYQTKDGYLAVGCLGPGLLRHGYSVHHQRSASITTMSYRWWASMKLRSQRSGTAARSCEWPLLDSADVIPRNPTPGQDPG
jgi:crotonobetainyl-CoA:carnitine CoA-transferase CaiB-like acyl-CoA transferase